MALMTQKIAMITIRFKRAVPLSAATRRGSLLGTRTSSQFGSRQSEALQFQQKVEKRFGYHKHSLSETAMYRLKQLLGGKLSLSNYNAQIWRDLCDEQSAE